VSDSDQEQVLAANQRFYAAFESLDLGRMEQAWLQESYISCVHPGWPPLFGWGAIMQSWQQIFDNALAMRFKLTDVRVQTAGEVAWVLLTENIESRHTQGSSSGVVQATNIYRRRGTQWLIVHHHGSTVVHPAESGATRLQ
jgi:ketosteroid isomerase-like protein